MKISKSKQELARIISENGGWRDGAEFAAQDKKSYSLPNMFWFYADKPKKFESASGWRGQSVGDGVEARELIKNWHQTILSREEYFHLYPAPDADGWIEWNGGECPVENGSMVDVKKTDGSHELAVRDPQDRIWNDKEHRKCIVAYRLHKPEQAKPEFCESVTRSIPEPSDKPTIEQLAAEYRSAKDYAARKQQEADAAKADAEARLKALELACEALGLLVSPITAKQGPELMITDWRDLRVGDVVFVYSMTCSENEFSLAMVGRECVVVSDGEMYPVCLINEFTPPGESYWLGGCCDEISWRFIRRP